MTYTAFYDKLLSWGLIAILILMVVAVWKAFENEPKTLALPGLILTGLYFASHYQAMSIQAAADPDYSVSFLLIAWTFLCGLFLGSVAELVCAGYIILFGGIFLKICAYCSKTLDKMKYVRNADGSQILDEHGHPMENDLSHFTFFQSCRFVIPFLLWIGGIYLGFMVLRHVLGFLLIARF